MFRKLTFFALVLALCVIVIGSYVRLSDAGLGCPDWPGCYGQAMVSDDAEFKQQAQMAYPGNPLDIVKAWKEMVHRYFAGALGLLVLVLALISWREKHCRTSMVISSIVLLSMVVFQALLGMWTVEMRVMPIIVTSHLTVGLLTFWLLYWMYLRDNPLVAIRRPWVGRRKFWLGYLKVDPEVVLRKPKKGPRGLASFAMLVLFFQIVLGGLTSTHYAALACTDLPQCNGLWWPQLDFQEAVNILRALLYSESGALSYDGKVALHWLHRVGALVTFLVLALVYLATRSSKNARSVRTGGSILFLMLLLEISLGIANIKLGLPIWSAVAHNGFAALLMLPLIAIRFYSKYGYFEEPLVEEEAPELPELVEEVAVKPVPEEIYVEKEPETLYLRLTDQLKKTRSSLGGVLSAISLGQKRIDQDLLEEIETSLIMADVGIDATSEIIRNLSESVGRSHLNDAEALSDTLKQQLINMLEPCNKTLHIPEQEGPFVILVVGVNGAGKTTTIGKLAKRLQAQGHSVMLAAGDTFRAAAVEQLETWGERNDIHVVAQHTGADSASVIFDGVQSAKAKGVDVLIADTAGRLHTKSNLMDELKKIKRIIGKLDENAPHEVLLVLDSGTGQNALSQAKLFNEAVELTGIALTKLDGTAKGGVIFALAKQFGIPIRFIGIGEGIDDLQDFHAEQFVDALFVND